MDSLKRYITDTQDFPVKGVLFRDVSPLLKEKLPEVTNAMLALFSQAELKEIDYIAGIESRGFIIGSIMAQTLGKGFVMIRKKGKLPNPDVSESYALEYGEATLEMHSGKGKIILVDDVLATGGTLSASAEMAVKAGYEVKHLAVLIDLKIMSDYSWHGMACRSAIQY
jgi:adenine phosphoribosyltransferase